MPERSNLLLRFRRWAIWAIAAGAILYVGGSVWAGLGKTSEALRSFQWWLYLPVLALTLVNYSLRFVKWHTLLGRLGVQIPWRDNANLFIAGLAMVISPAKAGEVLKPYVISQRTGVSMATTVPALISERLTDGIAMLALAAISVGTYASDKVSWVLIPSVLVAAGLAVLASRRATDFSLSILARLPFLARLVPRITELVHAMRACLEPRTLVAMTALSLVAWWAECLGYWLVLRGVGIEASLDAATFLYAFATVAGGAMPGGLGVADGALAGGAVTILGAPESAAVAAAMLVRVATLWLGVLMGAFAMLRFESLLHAVEIDDGPADVGL